MSDERLRELIARVGQFHVTDRAMKSAQQRAEEALAKSALDEGVKAQYLRAVEAYFSPFEKEARAHLRDVDKRLEHANQVVFNLAAERAVAVKRIEATQSVLSTLGEI
jgi:hypothetical protein